MDPSTDSTAEAIKNALDALNNTNSGVNSSIEMTECNTATQQQLDLQTQQNQLQAEQQLKMMQYQQKQFLQYLHEQRITATTTEFSKDSAVSAFFTIAAK
ncbi:hypothetical protein R5R35_000172 [Gryllus longicercus]|uniref:Uncharacterized protein n=1 Tax=Gryllus longicercus TaxID=2509291 RepID=A0AAN9WP20_9ORTH